MSTSHRRRLRRQNAVLLLILALLTVAVVVVGCRSIFRPPEINTETPGAPESSPADEPGGQAPSPEELAAQEALRSHRERKEGFYTILVSGADDGNGNSDTNILVAVDTKEGAIYGVSIPRDTKAEWGGKTHKINAAFAVGGMEKLAEVVSHQLGIPVDCTVMVDLQGFVALVDAIGGVEFYVPVDMDYEDPYQDLTIHIPEGQRRLTGEEALKVVRFRSGYASQDIGRMETQQKFLKAAARQLFQLSNADKLDDFVRIFKEYVETDLELGELAWLGKEALAIGPDNIQFSTLPGQWKNPYIHPDPEGVLQLVNQHLNPYVEDRVPEDLHIPS